MKIDPISFGEQLKMMRGVGGVTPKDKNLLEGISQAPTTKEKVSFSDFLTQQFNQVNTQGLEAEQAITNAVSGKEVNPHSAIIAVQKANVSLSLMMSIKDRLEKAYQEILRMQV